MSFSKLLSLEKQYHFYKSYHSNVTNKRIHIVFIPVILVTVFMLLSTIPLPPPLSDSSRLVALCYAVYCFLLDPQIGLICMPPVLVLYVTARLLTQYAGPQGNVPWAAAFNFIAWFAQFVGHYAFEKNSPALMDSVVQSFLAAPVVIWIEILFSMGFLQKTKERLSRSRVVARARKAVAKSSTGS